MIIPKNEEWKIQIIQHISNVFAVKGWPTPIPDEAFEHMFNLFAKSNGNSQELMLKCLKDYYIKESTDAM